MSRCPIFWLVLYVFIWYMFKCMLCVWLCDRVTMCERSREKQSEWHILCRHACFVCTYSMCAWVCVTVSAYVCDCVCLYLPMSVSVCYPACACVRVCVQVCASLCARNTICLIFPIRDCCIDVCRKCWNSNRDSLAQSFPVTSLRESR